MNTPGRSVGGWWNCHNNAFYLEKLVRGSNAEEEPQAPREERDSPLIGLLWRPISFPKSPSAKARAARADAIPQPRKEPSSQRPSLIARTIGGHRDRG
jgi:hypothetical protein